MSRSPGQPSGWSRSTPHLMQVGVNLSRSAGPVLGEEMQSGRAAAQQLLSQLGTDHDPYPPNLIIVISDLVDPVCHRAWQRGPGQFGEARHLADTGDRHDARDDRNVAAG